MAIKITISKQMVACDKQKPALMCFWSVKYHTHTFLAWPGKGTRPAVSCLSRPRKALVWYFHSKNTLVQFSYSQPEQKLKDFNSLYAFYLRYRMLHVSKHHSVISHNPACMVTAPYTYSIQNRLHRMTDIYQFWTYWQYIVCNSCQDFF
jgi:hypothetical protein